MTCSSFFRVKNKENIILSKQKQTPDLCKLASGGAANRAEGSDYCLGAKLWHRVKRLFNYPCHGLPVIDDTNCIARQTRETTTTVEAP